jgi:His/Glu/Gln/Arg/opine family amino acid ABC transporter permease subunit
MSFDYDVILTTLPVLVRATGVTIGVSLAAMACGVAGAIALMIAESQGGSVVRRLLRPIQSLVFGTPPLVMIFSAYYLLPRIGLDLGAWGAGIAALATFSSFFLKEALRGALEALPRGLIEAAISLGLRSPTVWLKIKLPLILRSMVPPLINELTLIVKATALLSAITVTDVMRTAQQIYASNYRPLETLLAAAIVYAVINLSISLLGTILEARFRIVGDR